MMKKVAAAKQPAGNKHPNKKPKKVGKSGKQVAKKQNLREESNTDAVTPSSTEMSESSVCSHTALNSTEKKKPVENLASWPNTPIKINVVNDQPQPVTPKESKTDATVDTAPLEALVCPVCLEQFDLAAREPRYISVF